MVGGTKPEHMTPARVRVGSRPTFLERLAVVFADPIRLKIVWELYRREMSPSEFHSLFGEGSLSRVDRHFKRLAEHDWLRQVRKETGGRRRGSTEHFYRAPKLAIFDNETWAQLPLSLREEFSWRIFEQFAERVKAAFEAGTFETRADRHFTWSPLVLDEHGRSRALAAVDTFFSSLFDEEDDAELRLARSGEETIHTTVGLAVFDSPNRRRNLSGLALPTATLARQDDESVPLHARLARVFSNALNLKIVAELNLRAMSPSEFGIEFDLPLGQVDRQFKMLAVNDWLEKVDEKTGGTRRGATENFYRATGPAIFDTRSWSRVSEKFREGGSWRIFEQLAEQVREALNAKTFDLRTDRHHTWTPLLLDQQGWDQLIAEIDALLYYLLAEQTAAKRRLSISREEPLIATVYLAAFESPAAEAGRHTHDF
jgi:hypothetical protein